MENVPAVWRHEGGRNETSPAVSIGGQESEWRRLENSHRVYRRLNIAKINMIGQFSNFYSEMASKTEDVLQKTGTKHRNNPVDKETFGSSI